jgi:hypothetical protein
VRVGDDVAVLGEDDAGTRAARRTRRAEIVTTDGTTFAAIAVVWLTESVLLTVTFCGVEVTTVCDCGKIEARQPRRRCRPHRRRGPRRP